jgi:hypothetical protein
MMEAEHIPETLVSSETTRRYIPDGRHLHRQPNFVNTVVQSQPLSVAATDNLYSIAYLPSGPLIKDFLQG